MAQLWPKDYGPIFNLWAGPILFPSYSHPLGPILFQSSESFYFISAYS